MKDNLPLVQPVVCCVENRYVICIPASEEALISVSVNGQEYTCDDNGVRKSKCPVHKIEVPMNVLDAAEKYTVIYQKMLERRPYRSSLAEAVRFDFAFRPLSHAFPIRIAHLSDVHGLEDAAIQTGSLFHSELDLLILNGDISSSSNNLDEALLPLRIAFAITKGERPSIITRGNHDLRGKAAELLGEIYPTDQGRMYYTVRFPALRFLVLDCGEDKVDTHVEYGGTAAFHAYRQRETAFLSALCSDDSFVRAETPLIVVAHIPFPHTDGSCEFAIEEPLYAEWCKILKEKLHPSFGLFGHHHQIKCMDRGDPFDTKKIDMPMILGGLPVNGLSKDVHGAFLTINPTDVNVVFSNKKHEVLSQSKIDF